MENDFIDYIFALETLNFEERKVKDQRKINEAMKLIFCTECRDIVRLPSNGDLRKCICGRSSGFYTGKDEQHAEISGPCIPIGFSNADFHKALNAQPKEGWGVRFEAFVIPKKVPTIRVVEKKS